MLQSPNRPKRHLTAAQIRKHFFRISLYGMLTTGFLLAGHWASGASTTLIWDANTTTAGVQDGSGAWDSSTANWWNGSGDVAWMDSTVGAPVFAQFGGGNNTITSAPQITVNSPAGGFNVAGLIFATETGSAFGYLIGSAATPGAINIADGGTITLGDNVSTSGAFVSIFSALSGNNITIQRTGVANTEQFLQLSGANTLGGTLTLNGGTATSGLFVRVTNPGALNTISTVIVPATATLDLQGAGATYTSNFQVAGTGDSTGGRGAIRFDSDQMTLTGTITLTGNTVMNFQSSTPTASNVTFAEGPGGTGGITQSGGSFSFTKTGLGTLTLQAASNYTGSTIIAPAGASADPGTLLLNFATASPAVTTPMLYNGVAAGALVLTGNAARTNSASTATFSMLGALFDNDTQSFSGLTVTGPTAITLTSGAAGSVDVSLGAITRTAVGSMLTITAPASGNITTTSSPGTLLGTWTTYIDPNGLGTWAGTDGSGNIDAFTGDLTYTTGTNISALPGYTTASNLRITNTSSGAVAQAAGPTTINSITMSATSADRVVTVGAGNTLDLGAVGGIQIITGARSLTIGTTPNTGTLTAGTAANAELFLSNFDSTKLLTINSVIANNASGAVNVELNGSGTVILAGTNTYTGTTIVNSGTLEITSNSALGAFATAAENTLVGFGATLQLTGGLTISEPLTLNGTGVSSLGALHNTSGASTSNGLITIGGTASIIADAGSSLTLFHTSTTTTVIGGLANVADNVSFGGGGTIFVNSVIASTIATLTKTDSGTLFLTAANAYTGSTTITGGVIQVSNAAGLGSTAGGTIVNTGGGAALQLTGGITIGAEALFLNGAGVSNDGALRNISGNNNYGGTVTLQSATRINSDSGTLTLTAATLTGAFPLTFGGAGNVTVNSAINTGAGAVTKDGTGTLTLNGTNTYTGVTTISNGILAMGANNVFADADPITVDGGTLAISTFSDTVGPVTLKNGAITGTTGVLNSAVTYNVLNGTISANLAGTAVLGLTKSSTNTVILSGTNTFTGTITVQDGRLLLDYSGGNTVVPADAVALAGGLLEVKGGGNPITLGALSTTANTGLSTLTVDANTALTAASYTRGSASTFFINLSAAGSSLNFTSAPLVTDGQIVGTGGSNAAVVMEDSNGRFDFAALGAGNSVVRLNAATALPLTGGSVTAPDVLNASNTTVSLTGNVATSSLRIDTTAGAGTLDLNGKTLTLGLFGILVDGSNNFSIINSGTGGGLGASGASATFIYQYSTGTLTLAAPITAMQSFLMGTGLIDWTAPAGNIGATDIFGATVRLDGPAITLNNSVTTGNGIGPLNLANGGILELTSGPFTRAVGTGNNQVSFFAGDAGFSAFGSDQVVNLGGAGASFTWGGTGGTGAFLASGAALILGSPFASATVDFQNSLNLNGGYQTVAVLSPNVTGVGGKISGAITGTGGGLTKAGQGILNLAGANTYTGFTAVSAGTLLVTGSINSSSP